MNMAAIGPNSLRIVSFLNAFRFRIIIAHTSTNRKRIAKAKNLEESQDEQL
jgi:hypothetical protein